MRRLLAIPLALALFCSPASAVTIHQHIRDPSTGEPLERVLHVAPPDSDDDGCPNSEDNYDGAGCQPPAPTPTYNAPAYNATTSGGCPSYMSGESSSPTATNPSSGAYGCFQILPSTHDSLGCTDYGAGCAARICAAQGNDAWVAADPCDYLGTKP